MVVDIFILLLTIGLPRYPDSNLPLVIVPLILRFFTLYNFYKSNKIKVNIFNFLFLCYFLIVLCVYENWVDLLFAFSLGIKMYLGFLAGIIVGEIFVRRIKAVYYWLLIQIAILLASIFFSDVYLLMTKFISKDSSDVFVEIFGLRTLGFGLYHAEGAVLLVILIYYLAKHGESVCNTRFYVLVRGIGYVCAIALARSAFIPLLLLILRRNLFKSILACIFLSFLALNINDDVQILYEGLEIFRNLLTDGELKTKSTDANLLMFFFPESMQTLISGDGKFFNNEQGYSSGFYLGSDVGWVRVVFFGGVFYSLLYIFINSYWFFSLQDKIIFIELFILFLIMNLKGIFVFSFVAVMAHIINKRNLRN